MTARRRPAIVAVDPQGLAVAMTARRRSAIVAVDPQNWPSP
jgi:hypothetical protein